MNFREALLREHSRKQAQKIAAYIGDDAARLKAFIEVYLAGPYRITQRAAWALSMVAEQHPHRIKPHLPKLLRFLRQPQLHDAVRRNTFRLLQYTDIPKRLRGEVADLCFSSLLDKSTAVAIKAFAITVLTPIVQDEPDLQREFRVILEDQLPYAKPAFVVRARRALRTLDIASKSPQD